MNVHGRKLGNHVPQERFRSEQKLGITERTSPIDFGWCGDQRKRFTDFLVYEVKKDGTVIHLDDFEEPKQAKPREPTSESSKVTGAQDNKNTTDAQAAPEITVQEIPEEDRQVLADMLGLTVAGQVLDLDRAIQLKTHDMKSTPMKLGNFTDRTKRGRMHQELRRIFSARIETTTDSDGDITAVAFKPMMSDNWRKGGPKGGRNPSQQKGSQAGRATANDGTRHGDGNKSFSQLGGEYLHCTLYKENKDTMDATNMIARFLRLKSQSFGFSGTKDRRAATVQRISIHRQRANNIIWLNSKLMGIRMGDFKHSKYPIQLGQHGGNEFVITLKNVEHVRGANAYIATRVKMIEESVETGLRCLHENGFLNYFGLQRFGTHAIGTHELGTKILKGDFQGAIDDICSVPADLARVLDSTNPDDLVGYQQDDISRARALTLWADNDAKSALDIMPKRYNAEYKIIQHLSQNSNDYMGALLTITRGLRQMYIHGYQSYVWNHVASYRWAKYGSRVIEGDLIMLDFKPKPTKLDDDDEDLPDPSGEWEDFYAHVRHLTAEDVASGRYTIFDIVLPQPGYDVMYPKNDVGEFYKNFMATKEGGELDPYNMRRKQKEFSLSGGYRNLMARFMTTPEYLVRTYSHDEEQMYPTDLDLILEKKAREQAEIKDLKRRRSLVDPAPAPGSVAEQAAAAQNKRAKVAGEDVAMEDAPAPAPAAAATEAESQSAFLLAKLREISESAPATPPAVASSSASGAPGAVPAGGPSGRPAAPAMPLLRQISGDTTKKFAPGRYTWGAEASHGDKIAVILKFQLPSSSYATIMLRELQTALAGERNPKCE